MKSYSLPFLMLNEFAKLPRPEKLLLIGLYHQWINNNCLPVRLDKVDINMLRLLTNSNDLSLESLHERKWLRMRRCGLLFSDQSISFVTNPEDNSAVNLALRKSEKPISSRSKHTINVRKTCVKVRKHDVNVRKSNAKVRKPYTDLGGRNEAEVKKSRQHPNFLTRKRDNDDAYENRTK